MTETAASKLYVVHPGWVVSKSDGQHHYVGVGQLMRLYGLSRARRDVVLGQEGRSYPPGAVHLYPRSDGKYEPVQP